MEHCLPGQSEKVLRYRDHNGVTGSLTRLYTLTLFFFFFRCVMSVSLHVHMCTMCMPSTKRGQNRAPDPQELELLVMNCHVGPNYHVQTKPWSSAGGAATALKH